MTQSVQPKDDPLLQDLVYHVKCFVESNPMITGYGTEPVPLSVLLEKPEMAAGRCLVVSEELAHYLSETAGIDASVSLESETLHEHAGEDHDFYEQHEPCQLGMWSATPLVPQYIRHVVTKVASLDSPHLYTIDLTAHQFIEYANHAAGNALFQRIDVRNGTWERWNKNGWKPVLKPLEQTNNRHAITKTHNNGKTQISHMDL